MSYDADDHFPEVNHMFGTSLYNDHELAVIKKYAGVNPRKAIPEISPEDLNVHRHQFRDSFGKDHAVVDSAEDKYQQAARSCLTTVQHALTRFYELQDMQESEIRDWCGVSAVVAGIDKYQKRLELGRKRKAENPQGAGHNPEMWNYDTGAPKYQGRGTDAGRLRRYDIELYDIGHADLGDFTKMLEDATDELQVEAAPTGFRMGEDYVGCPECNWQKEFDPGSDQSRYRAEKAVQMHMNNIQTEREAHRESLERIKATL